MSKVSSSMMAGTGMVIHSLGGGRSGLDGGRRCVLAGGLAVDGRRRSVDAGLEERGPAHIGGVLEHQPDDRAVPAVLAGAGRDPLGGEPAGQLADGDLLLGVAAEHLAHDVGFVLDDLVAGFGDVGAANVAVAEGGAAENVDHSGAGPKGLAPPGSFDDQGPLVLGHHSLELQQHLVLGGLDLAGLDEADLGSRLVELVDQAASDRRACGPGGQASSR